MFFDRFFPPTLSLLLLSACSGGVNQATQQPTTTPPQISSAQPPAKSAESLTIGFENGGTKLTPAAIAELDRAARLYRDAGPEVMIVSGHSDKSGSEYANLLLSARRAEQVKHALVDRGVPADRLQIVAIGQAEPVAGLEPARSAVVTWR